MAEERHLNSAPIKEAIIEFRVNLPEQTTMEVLDQASSRLTTEYSNKSILKKGSFSIQVNDDAALVADHEQTTDGYRNASPVMVEKSYNFVRMDLLLAN